MAKSPTRNSHSNRKIPTRRSHASSKVGTKKIAVIGSGWYGKEIALALKKNGHKVIVYERGEELASGTSGLYSSRTHPSGLHYLRVSHKMVNYLKQHYNEFVETRGKYLRPNRNAVHGIVYSDANGAPSRTNVEEFRERYKLDDTARRVEHADFGLQNVQEPVAIKEERIINGEELREQFRLDLRAAGVEFLCDTAVQEIQEEDEGFLVKTKRIESKFDHVINATGFQKFVPDTFKNNPFNIQVIYQAASGFLYEDMQSGIKENFSLLFLDGANPCLMQSSDSQYILTHGKYTLLASRNTPEEARQALDKAKEINLLESKIKPLVEADLLRYYPNFFERFKYVGYNCGVVAKVLTETEFRLGFALQTPDKVIHAMLGKISNAPAVARECVQLVESNGTTEIQGYAYPSDGILSSSMHELGEKPQQQGKHYACLVNPYPELDAPKSKIASDDNSGLSWQRTNEGGRLHRADNDTVESIVNASVNSINSELSFLGQRERRSRSNSLTSEIRESFPSFGVS